MFQLIQLRNKIFHGLYFLYGCYARKRTDFAQEFRIGVSKTAGQSIRTSHSRFSGFIYILFRPFLSLPRISRKPGTGTYVVDGDFQTVGNFGNGFIQRFNHVEHYARIGFLTLLVNRYARKQRQAGSNDFLLPRQTFRKQDSLKTAAGVGQFQKSVFVAGFADALLKRVDAAGHFGADAVAGADVTENFAAVFDAQTLHALAVTVKRMRGKIKADGFRFKFELLKLRPSPAYPASLTLACVPRCRTGRPARWF